MLLTALGAVNQTRPK